MDQLECFSIESRDRCVSLRCQYIDLYKPINNGILTLILLLHLLNLKKTLFISQQEAVNLILYVDDILICANDLTIIRETRDFLLDNFEGKIWETHPI